MDTSLVTSAYTSLVLQFLTGAVESTGLFLPVEPEHEIVRDVLAMELTVQAIEFLFYVYLVYMIVSDRIDADITRHRYIDWVITTPVMLVSFVVFFKYLKDPTRKIELFDSIREEAGILLHILAANALMLLLGFLAETGVIHTYVGVTLGFIPFAYAFKLLYAHYVKDNEPVAYWLYYVSFLVWGLYGVAAVLAFAPKNTMYNILDLFAKNAYGLFLFAYLRSVRSVST